MSEHLAQNHVESDHIYQVPANFNLLAGTPTLLFVNDEGTVQRAFVGELNRLQEEQVLALIKSGNIAASTPDRTLIGPL